MKATAQHATVSEVDKKQNHFRYTQGTDKWSKKYEDIIHTRSWNVMSKQVQNQRGQTIINIEVHHQTQTGDLIAKEAT